MASEKEAASAKSGEGDEGGLREGKEKEGASSGFGGSLRPPGDLGDRGIFAD